MRHRLLFLLVCQLSTSVNAQWESQKRINYTDSTAADKEWTRYPIYDFKRDSFLEGFNSVFYVLENGSLTAEQKARSQRNLISFYHYREQFSQQLLQWGLRFWHKYPQDPRRYLWLENIIGLAPDFYQNVDSRAIQNYSDDTRDLVVLNMSARIAWKKQLSVFRNEFMTDSNIDEKRKQAFLRLELLMYVSDNRFQQVRHSDTGFSLSYIAQRILELAPYYYEYERDSIVIGKTGGADELKHIVYQVVNFAVPCYKSTYSEVEQFLKTIQMSVYPELSTYAQQKRSFIALRNDPIQIRYTAIDGRNVDLQQLRGKMVLLDFWSLSCGACIVKMPEIKKVYEQYKSEGFEVISIAANPEIDRSKILEIYERVGADWPLLLIGGQSIRSGWCAPGSLMRLIWAKYGFTGVPQLLLLDREGKLVADNTVLLDEGGVEKELLRLLDQEKR